MVGVMVTDPGVSNGHPSEISLAGVHRVEKLGRLPDPAAEQLSLFFKLLSDPMRLRILHYLMQRKELNVSTLCSLLDKTQPAVSHHLALLRSNDVIELRRAGKHNFYRISSNRLKAVTQLLFAVTPQEDDADIQFDGFQLHLETDDAAS